MKIDSKRLEEIRAGAERVEFSGWRVEPGLVGGEGSAVVCYRGMVAWRVAECRDGDASAHIANMDPVTTIQLLDEIGRLTGEIERLVEVIDERSETMRKRGEKIGRVRGLMSEINCRIEHGADSNGHLKYVEAKLKDIVRDDG